MAYIFVFIFSLIFFYLASKTLSNNKRLLGYTFLCIAILIPSLLAGFRDMHIGTDTKGYVQPYFEIALSCSTYKLFQLLLSAEPLYGYLTYIVSECTRNVGWLLFFIQFFILGFICLSVLNLKKYDLLPFSAFIYFFAFYNRSLNMTRQMMAMAICLYAFSFLLKRRYYWSLLFAFISLGFHSTSFLFFIIYPLFFIVKECPSKKMRILLFLATSSVLFLQDSLIQIFINRGMLSDKFLNYTSSGIWGSNLPLSDLFYALFFFVTIWKAKRYIIKYIDDYYYFQTLSSITIILCFAALNSTFAVRVMYYISFLSILIIPLCVNRYFFKQKHSLYLRTIIACLLFYWFMSIPYANLGETYPYSSKILQY